MNMIMRLLTISFMISMLAFGMAGYAGSKSRTLPFYEAYEDLQASFAIMLQGSDPFGIDGPAPGTCGICFGDSAVLPPVCSTPELRPF